MVKYICLYCKKDFVKRWNYSTHFKSCEYNFNKIITKYKSYNKNILIDEYIQATKDKIYICEFCKKKYTSYNGLKIHIKTNGCEKTELSICEKIKNKLIVFPIKNSPILNKV